MDFFYPNFNNDFWRMMGLVHFGDAQHFVAAGGKRFNYPAVVDFCRQAGLAFFDTASKVRRLKDNASDAFLEILQPTDIGALLARLPHCHAIVTTGGKASGQFAALLNGTAADTAPLRGTSPLQPSPLPTTVSVPAPGGYLDVTAWGRALRWWRMPSTSRAYPLALSAKAAAYARLWP